MTVAFARPSPKPEMPHCPLCGMDSVAPAWSAPDGVRAAHACGECGLTYIWPRLEQEFSQIPEQYYYHSFESLDLSGSSFLFGDVSAAIGRRIAHGFNRNGTMPTILDAGCGAGHALLTFRAHGWGVEGVDPWKIVTTIGRKYYRLPIQDGRLETSTITPTSKDVVIALDVLQFNADPKAFLAAALKALRPGGLLYLTLPNYGSLASRRDGWKHHNFSPTTYLSYFTPDTIRRLLEESGYYRIQVSCYGGADGDERLRVLARRAIMTEIGWSDLSDEVPDAELPPLDRKQPPVADLSADQAFWRDNGYLVVPNLIPDDLVDRYYAVRQHVSHAQGWNSPTPYLDVPEIRDLCLYKPLSDRLEHLLGEPVGLHLNLTGWVSTERDWHQDDYLNPPEVNGHYIAVWMALDTIHADAGPFEFVPGSHRWPIIRQAKVLNLLGQDGSDHTWPAESERVLTPFFEDQIKQRGVKSERFLGKRGDVLIWHARLLHRGSLPGRPGAERRSMIAHYSALTHRHDMPVKHQHPGGGWFFVPGAVPDRTHSRSGKRSLSQYLARLLGTGPRMPEAPQGPAAPFPVSMQPANMSPLGMGVMGLSASESEVADHPVVASMPAAQPETVIESEAAPLAQDQPEPASRPTPEDAPPEAESASLATPRTDWRYDTELGRLRADLARRYIRGAGIEFGALDFPVPVPPGVAVTHADFQAGERIKYLFSVEGEMPPPVIVSDLETMRGIEAESQDFIIANHVLEHTEDPLKALRSISRVLRPGGIAFIALPDKRYTFDKPREITTLDHLLRDHAEGPDWSLAGHYDEWVRCVDGLTGDAHAKKVACMLEGRLNIHFHAWDFAAMMEMFSHVERDESFGLIVENATHCPIEVVWILRKRARPEQVVEPTIDTTA